jgi:hypothetical protein
MTALTFGWSTGKFLPVAVAVAGFTVSHGMHTCKRKSFLDVQLDNITPGLPIPGSMTILAVVSELTQMMVSVAIGAGCSDIAENQFLMTASAIGLGVRAIEPESSFVMIKFHGRS